MAEAEPLNYEAVCKIVGQLYLESHHELEKVTRELVKARQERDDVLRTLQDKK